MHTRQMNEASRSLLALAKRNAQVYASQLNARAIMVTGSAAEGISDFYSDLDMIVYYDQLPSEEEFLMAMRHNQGEDRRLLGEPSTDEVGEDYRVNGVECQVGHTTIAGWEHEMASVREYLDITSPSQKALSGMLEAIPLYGDALIQQWQDKLAIYPDALAIAMINHYQAVFPLWGLQKSLAVRDATIWTYQLLTEGAFNLLGILAGLNRCYYTPFQFKRTRRFIAQLTIVPENLADRLEAIFHADQATAIAQIEDLTRETVALVEQHMPQVNISALRQSVGWRRQPWQDGI